MNYLNLLWFLPLIGMDIVLFIYSKDDRDYKIYWLLMNLTIITGVFTAIGLIKVFK